MCKVVCNAPPQLVVLRFAKASPGVGLLRSHIAPVTCHELSRCAFAILHINSTLPAAARTVAHMAPHLTAMELDKMSSLQAAGKTPNFAQPQKGG